jgi:UDP-2-acetamido-3-amino-2,3-dideoxy-glucuronate N-acetyltransferase
MNIAVVGMGYWGKNLVRNFYELGALGVVCDQEGDRASVVQEKYPGTQFVTEYRDVLDNPDIHAVALATPAMHHYAMTRAALEAGKDVYVEKPLALNVKEGEELNDLADREGRILMVGHILRYHPAILKLADFIKTGVLGKIRYIYSNRLNIGKIRAEENILWSFAPHDMSVMLGLLEEEPDDVECRGESYLNTGVPDVTMTTLSFPSGVRGHIFVSWLHPFKEQRLVIVGSEKMAVFDDRAEDKLVVYPHRVEWSGRVPVAVKAEAESIPLDAKEPLKEECSHFLACVEKRARPVTDGREGVRVLRVLEGCEISLARKRPVQLSGIQNASDFDVHESAYVDPDCRIGKGTKIWHFSHVLSGAKIGDRCILGQNVHVAGDVCIGNNVKIQNNVSVYTGTVVEDDVFLGPSCVLTNVTNPRSQVNRHALYEKTFLRRGATVGANATLVCGITVGRYAFVGAGAVVTKDVPDYALVMGNPASPCGWMSRHGHRLKNPDDNGIMVCPESGYRYQEDPPGVLRCLDLDEEQPLPREFCKGSKSYDDFKR